MNTDYLPNSIKQEKDEYTNDIPLLKPEKDFRIGGCTVRLGGGHDEREEYAHNKPFWSAMKIFYMGSCALALLGSLAVKEEHRDTMLGVSLLTGLTSYGIHKHAENKKRSIENRTKYFNHFEKITWQEKEDYLYAEKAKEKKEKQGVGIIGAGLLFSIMGHPVLGGVLTLGGLFHNNTSRDFINIQGRIVDKYAPRSWEIQKQTER